MEMRPNTNVTDKPQHKLCNTRLCNTDCTKTFERRVNERQQSNHSHLN